MEIKTRRFVLRDFREEDRHAFGAYQTDPRYLEVSGPEVSDPGHALGLLQTFKVWASELPRRNHQLAIIEKKSQELIGSCGLRSAGCNHGSAVLGIELAPKYWGSYGYAIEVACALLAFGFNRLGLQEIYGVTTSGNAPVVRLANWFEAEATAIAPGPAWMEVRGWSQVRWRITVEQWSKLKTDRKKWQAP
jgi:RimJ/RimL family protein N-acetyltransferase